MGCLDENLVTALLERSLSVEKIADVDEHVAHCTKCHALLAELARVDLGERATEKSTPSAIAPAVPPEGAALGAYLALANAQRRIGSVLQEKWTLERVLGIGGMAQVYAAKHRNGNNVAIKILRPELSAEPSLLPRFLREGYVANKVGHPSAVSVLDDGMAEDGAAFMVMELLEGETLRDRLARVGPLPVADVLRFADEILDVLVAAHSKAIIHRDIKPENIFLPKDGGIKVLDFGIARIRELTRESGNTESGVAMGTPAYMPPEQARGRWELVDGRSDLWALGATMFTLLTGAQVREGKSTNEELLSAMTEPVRSIAGVMPKLPAAVAQIVDRALYIDRERRWPDAAAMQRAVRHAAAGGHIAPVRRTPGAPWRAVMLALIGAVTFAAIAFRSENTADRTPSAAPAASSATPQDASLAASPAAPPDAAPTAPPAPTSSAPRVNARPPPTAIASASASSAPSAPPPQPSASSARDVMDRRR